MSLNKTVIFRIHAVRRMFERNISVEDVKIVLEKGVVLESYLDDKPYPSYLVLGWIGIRPIHVVMAHNVSGNKKIVVTVYEPGNDLWNEDFTRRKKV